jgi:hypothetical protein
MPNLEDATEQLVVQYERGIGALYAAVAELVRLGVPHARVLVLTQAACDRAGAQAVVNDAREAGQRAVRAMRHG